MNIDIQIYQHASLAPEIGVLAEFRVRFFREFPYLYVGTEDYEQNYLADYLANPTTRLIVARDAGKVIGIATGAMLSTELNIVGKVETLLQQHGIKPHSCFYLGEIILEPEYRSRGISKQVLELLKNAGREQGAERFCFLTVAREPNDIRCPADYISSDVIFEKYGFIKTDVSVTFEWPTIQADGQVENTANRLYFWIDRQ